MSFAALMIVWLAVLGVGGGVIRILAFEIFKPFYIFSGIDLAQNDILYTVDANSSKQCAKKITVTKKSVTVQ